jgi:hypothetical protein
LDKDDIVFAISQSGETADTLAAIKEAKRKSATAVGIVNVVGSSIPVILMLGYIFTLVLKLEWLPQKHLLPKLLLFCLSPFLSAECAIFLMVDE